MRARYSHRKQSKGRIFRVLIIIVNEVQYIVMEIYRVEEDDLRQLPETNMEKEIQLEERLIRAESAQIGGVDIFYIGRQEQVGDGSIFDILGLDEHGNTVIIELKRGDAPRDVIAQALEYASKIRDVKYEYLEEKYRTFIDAREESEESTSLREAHAEHFDIENALSQDDYNREQRLIIVAASFQDDNLLHMADFLREHRIDVIMVEYSRYRDETENVELLTTDAIRRPLSEEPASPSERSISDKERRRTEFWKKFSEIHRERGISGGTSYPESASYAIYVFTSTGRQKRPAFIRPTIHLRNEAYVLVRFYDKEFVRKEENKTAFEDAVEEAIKKLDVGLSTSIVDDFSWDQDENREFDKVRIDYGSFDHEELTDEETLEEIRHWFADVAQVYRDVLREMESEGRIAVD